MCFGHQNVYLRLLGVTGKRVAVRLNSGIDYLGMFSYWLCLPKGTLSCLDGYMNIAMEETTEHVDGQLKNHLGDAFIRGNNGKHILKRQFAYPSVLYITALDG